MADESRHRDQSSVACKVADISEFKGAWCGIYSKTKSCNYSDKFWAFQWSLELFRRFATVDN